MNDEFDHRIHAALRDILDTAPPADKSPARAVSLDRPPNRRPARGLLLTVAVIAVVGGGIGAVIAVQSRSNDNSGARFESGATASSPSAVSRSASSGPDSGSGPPVAAESVEPTPLEQEMLSGLAQAGNEVGLTMTRSEVLVVGGSRNLDGAFENDTGELGVAFTVSDAESPPARDGTFVRSPAGYDFRFDAHRAEVRQFDGENSRFISLSIIVFGESELVLDEPTVTRIADALIAAIDPAPSAPGDSRHNSVPTTQSAVTFDLQPPSVGRADTPGPPLSQVVDFVSCDAADQQAAGALAPAARLVGPDHQRLCFVEPSGPDRLHAGALVTSIDEDVTTKSLLDLIDDGAIFVSAAVGLDAPLLRGTDPDAPGGGYATFALDDDTDANVQRVDENRWLVTFHETNTAGANVRITIGAAQPPDEIIALARSTYAD